MTKAKVLVVRSNSDSFNLLESKIKKLNSKPGPFDAIIVLGDLEDNINSADVSEFSQLFLLESNEYSEIPSKEIKENVTVLNNFGIYQLASKMTIAYVTLTNTGISNSKDEVIKKFNNVDKKVDILITHEWTSAIAKEQGRLLGNQVVDDIVKAIQPKYHFSYSDESKYFELNPFKWPHTDRITRFINVATLSSKEKWAYAFNIELDDDRVEAELPTNLISNPYIESELKKRLSAVLLIDKTGNNADNIDEPRVKKQRTVLPSNCHFCFANPNIEDHMFVSINTHSYVTTSKGPLSVPKGDMDFSGHCLIVPIEHIPKVYNKRDDTTVNELSEEIMKYETSLVEMNYKKFDMSTVVFEIQSSRSVHFHKQIIPIPKYIISKFQDSLDRQVHFNNEKYINNEKLNFKQFSSDALEYKDIVQNYESNYLQFTVYETSESTPVIFLASIEPDARIDLQFGRRVLAFLLRLPKRIKWDSPICNQTKDQEIEEVKKFQKGYKDFDISV